jgi:uncharacterized membrane protein YccC
MNVLNWVRQHDRGLAALRRAGRTAIVMPALFALGDKVFGNPALATFAAFGSFAMLLLVDFTGPMRERLQNQALLAVVGVVFVVLGTLASQTTWLAVVAMTAVAFVVIFAGVVSSVLAGATTSLLLAFILPVSLPGPVSSIPDRLAGWGLASVVTLVAIAVLWPAPAQDPLRGPAAAACRALAARLHADVAFVLSGHADTTRSARADAVAESDAAVAELNRVFLATPYRPTGLSTSARTVVRLVDEVRWLDAVLAQDPVRAGGAVNRGACAVKAAAATALERGADLLTGSRSSGAPASAGVDGLAAAVADLRGALDGTEQDATGDLPVHRATTAAAIADAGSAGDVTVEEFVTSLEPTFRAQEISFAVSQIAANIELSAAAERRTWWARLAGHQPAGLTSAWSAAQERAVAHVERHSVWLHNSLRGSVGLGLAVLVADLTNVQHSFWVVLGALSVLRSNALNTGQNVLRGLLGTVVGFVLGAALLAVIGTNSAVLWVLLAPAILVAGFAPAAISFAAGQAAFTLTLVILFNIIQPAGWQVGLLRVEDIALGCGVSLAVGLLFWPRGAGAALGQALAEAYTESARYLAEAVAFGMDRCDGGTPRRPAPNDAAVAAAAAARRLDDTFRTYLAERGSKPMPLAEVSSLVTGVAGLRLAADATLDLWRRDDGTAAGDRAAARRELLAATARVGDWYAGLADSLTGHVDVPVPLTADGAADARLIAAVRNDLRGVDGRATATAVRMIWTGDHVDAARRLQGGLVGPARTAHDRAGANPVTQLRWSHGLRPAPAPAR